MSEYCVCCGAEIPEGRMICPICEKDGGEGSGRQTHHLEQRKSRLGRLARRLAGEDELYRIMCETNAEYLSDERVNLNIQLSQPILVIADLGLWNGRRMGYKEIPSGNIRDCLSGGYDYTTWYVDKKGDFRCDDIHHDGTNHYLYRVYKDGVSEYQKDRLKKKLYEGTATRADVTRITRRLGDEIGKVYGWDFPKIGESDG